MAEPTRCYVRTPPPPRLDPLSRLSRVSARVSGLLPLWHRVPDYIPGSTLGAFRYGPALRRRFSSRTGFQDRRYSRLNLLFRRRGEIPDRQMYLSHAVSCESVRVVGLLMQIDENPNAPACEISKRPLRARIGAAQHSLRCPCSTVDKAQEHPTGYPDPGPPPTKNVPEQARMSWSRHGLPRRTSRR